MPHWGWRRDGTIQHLGRDTHDPNLVGGKLRLGGDGRVTPGFDPIIGQAPDNGPRGMDEPYPNYPAGSWRSTLAMPDQFAVLTAAAYFFLPSLTPLRTVLTAQDEHPGGVSGGALSVGIAELGAPCRLALMIPYRQSSVLPLEARLEVLSVPRR